jgi:hypothetical protein
MTMTMLLLLRFVALLSLGVVVTANCKADTCIEGSCIDDDCQCFPGFIGDDCSIPFTICEDGDRTCFNGSECERNNERDPVTLKYKYHCDCSKAFGISSFAGQQCEYSATVMCEKGVDVSDTTFCTNGGACVEQVSSGDAHQGCDCTNQFEGLHCQYLAGNAPPEELAAVQALQESRSSRSSDLSGVALFFIIVIPLIVVGMFIFFVWKRRQTGKDASFDGEDLGAGEVEIQSPKAAASGVEQGDDEEETTPEII